MKGSMLSRALFAIVLLPMVAQPQLSLAEPLSPPSGSYELTARLELPHLERWAWILEPIATGLCEADLHVFAKLFEDRLERGLEAQALSGREIGGDDDILNFFVGHLVDVDLTRQPAS